MILKELRREYKFYRLLYLNMVPQYILVKDKIIKQKFVSDKIIEIRWSDLFFIVFIAMNLIKELSLMGWKGYCARLSYAKLLMFRRYEKLK